MREDLVGYWFGSLDSAGRERVEQRLAEEPQLREQLNRIALALRPLEAEQSDVPPPPGLAERTLRKVRQRQGQEPWSPSARPWRLTDLAVAASILTLISLVLVPAVYQSRHRQLTAQCACNLHTISVALESYAEHFDGYLPFYSAGGPLGVAGICAPVLLEGGWVTDRATFICPGSGDKAGRIASMSRLRAAVHDTERLRRLLPSLGGSYGYPLGIKLDDIYLAPRRDRVPGGLTVVDRPPRPGECRPDQPNSPNHGGRGQNVLFRDGHVRFVVTPYAGPHADHIFRNQAHQVGPGLSLEDAVFGHSGVRFLGD